VTLAAGDAEPSSAAFVNDTLTAVSGVRVGHWHDLEARTGCTVILFPEGGAITSGLILGPAPGSRETSLLSPEKSVERVNALVLAGGSAFGLAAADGVMRYLDECGIGYPTPAGCVPIVPAAVLYDLAVGDGRVRPTAEAGRLAAEGASAEPVAQGAVGAGAGATVGKLAGMATAVRSGLGSDRLEVGGAVVAAIAISNAIGDLVDPVDGRLVAGSGISADVDAMLRGFVAPIGGNTTLVAVVTDAPLSKAQAHALALSAHIGIARVTRPSHTIGDGDSAFVSSVGTGPAVALGPLSVAVQEVVARALLKGARAVQASAA
jgi:L-aminopeptidase/D-esterase-like protein